MNVAREEVEEDNVEGRDAGGSSRDDDGGIYVGRTRKMDGT